MEEAEKIKNRLRIIGFNEIVGVFQTEFRYKDYRIYVSTNKFSDRVPTWTVYNETSLDEYNNKQINDFIYKEFIQELRQARLKQIL